VPNNNPSGAGAFEFPLRFPGQYFDRETNLNYNYFRDYDPGLGSYKQSDPIGLAGGLNTYLYVLAKPLILVDAFGLDNPGMGPYGPPWSDPPIRYNAPPPQTVPVNPHTERQVQCMMTKCQISLVITGGAEPWPHAPRNKGGKHPIGEAVDFGTGANPLLDPSVFPKMRMIGCACQCGFDYGGWEPDWSPNSAPHYHFQNGPGAGVPSLNCPGCP
jgi:RHS repeat-associated protein